MSTDAGCRRVPQPPGGLRSGEPAFARRTTQEQERIIGESLALFGDRIAAIHAKDFILDRGEFKPVRAGLGLLRHDLVMGFAVTQKPGISILLEDASESTAMECRQFLLKAAEALT